MTKQWNKYEQEALDEITRITGEIQEGYGVLLVRYDAWFAYNNDISMSVNVNCIGGQFTEDFEAYHTLVLADTRPKERLHDSFASGPIMPSLIKRPYPNKNYVSLMAKNGRKQSKFGIPFVAPIETLNNISEIEFRLEEIGNLIERHFEFPVQVDVSKERPFAMIHLKDMTYYNVFEAPKNGEQIKFRPLNECLPNISIEAGELGYNPDLWAWSYYSDIKEAIDSKSFSRYQWMSLQDVAAYEGDEQIVPDTLFLHGIFIPNNSLEDARENIIKIIGSESPESLGKVHI